MHSFKHSFEQNNKASFHSSNTCANFICLPDKQTQARNKAQGLRGSPSADQSRLCTEQTRHLAFGAPKDDPSLSSDAPVESEDALDEDEELAFAEATGSAAGGSSKTSAAIGLVPQQDMLSQKRLCINLCLP